MSNDPSALDAAASSHGSGSCGAVTACPTGDLAVRVLTKTGGTPVARALVGVDGVGEARTDDDGWATWSGLSPGSYPVRAAKAFHEPDPVTGSASVAASTVTTLELRLEHHVVVEHMWQEWHASAPAGAYAGPTADDRKVVEDADPEGLLRPKANLHLCFLERAAATFEAQPDGLTYYARWQILDGAGNVVREHPRFSAARYDASHADAKVSAGKQGWLWDGRDAAADPVFVPAGSYRTRLTVKDAAGVQVHESESPLAVEGSPYSVWITGRPMSDAELLRELADPRYAGRLLDTSGKRIARDCWILAHRGQRDDGHAVFLGKGTIEAQKTLATADGGAVATPHGRPYKAWVRANPHGAAANADRVQAQDLGVTDQTMALPNPGGPPANNPFADSAPNTPIKDGVQAHAGASVWVGLATSVGCTTVSAIAGATPNQPGAEVGALRSINSAFGSWGNGGSEDVSVEGPVFANKQRKRPLVADALRPDGHGAPLLDPPSQPDVGRPDEPLHMQPTLQRAAFGGFLGHEIPRTSAVADEPVNQLRVRLELEDYAPGSLYHLYHRAIVLGHTVELAGDEFRLRAWFPRKVIRGWNGHARNLLVTGRLDVAWTIEHRPPVPLAPTDFPALHPAGGVAGTLAALPGSDIGRARRTWQPPTRPAPALDAGFDLSPGEYYSVIRYRVELQPSAAASHAWVPEPALTDLLTVPLPAGSAAAGGRAALAAEQEVTVAGVRYLEGRSELLVHVVA